MNGDWSSCGWFPDEVTIASCECAVGGDSFLEGSINGGLSINGSVL